MDRSEVIAECRAAHGKREVSDECAREILRIHGGRNLSVLAYLTRGELPADDTDANGRVKLAGETKLWRIAFAAYSSLPVDDRLMGDMLGTYFIRPANERIGDNWA